MNTGKWEIPDLYKNLWIYLSIERSGKSGKAFLNSIKGHDDPTHWPDPLLMVLKGDLDPKDVRKHMEAVNHVLNTRVRKCEGYFFSGQYYLLNGMKEEARISFSRVRNIKVGQCVGSAAARYELEMLEEEAERESEKSLQE